MLFARPLAAVAPLVAVAMAGCLLRPRVDDTRYFILTATAPPGGMVGHAVRVGLGPVTLPGYLARASLATRVDAARVRYAERDRWAEPLDAQVLRTLGENLTRLLGTAQIARFPWFPGTPLDVTVQVAVSAFETNTAGTARLEASWIVRDAASGRVRHQALSQIEEPGDGPAPEAQVAALSRVLARLAVEIATVLARG